MWQANGLCLAGLGRHCVYTLVGHLKKSCHCKGFFVLVITPLPNHTHTHTQHGITCVSFSDARERDRFLHQVDRVVQLQQDKAVRVRARGDSEVKPVQSPTG